MRSRNWVTGREPPPAPFDFGLAHRERLERAGEREREELRQRALGGAVWAWIAGIAIYLALAIWIAEELTK